METIHIPADAVRIIGTSSKGDQSKWRVGYKSGEPLWNSLSCHFRVQMCASFQSAAFTHRLIWKYVRDHDILLIMNSLFALLIKPFNVQVLFHPLKKQLDGQT